MDTTKQVESILSSMREDLALFLSEEGSISTSKEYEERVLALSKQFAQSVISSSMGQMPKSRNSKKKS